jgi:hypothetical protein
VNLDSTRPPPVRLAGAVALLTAGMLLLELIATRLFSALFFYHYTFFAISLVMSGLTFGGLLAARWHVAALSEGEFGRRLAGLATLFSLGTLAALLYVLGHPPVDYGAPGLGTVLLLALAFLPGLTAAGAFLAAAFARDPGWIGRLYAADLAAAAAACAGAILLLRVVQGPAALLLTVLLAALAALVLRPGPRSAPAGSAARRPGRRTAARPPTSRPRDRWGEWAVQKMWAVNGAASIAGSALAVTLGLGLGCHAVLAAGFLCYLLVACCGLAAARIRADAAEHLAAAPGAAPASALSM